MFLDPKRAAGAAGGVLPGRNDGTCRPRHQYRIRKFGDSEFATKSTVVIRKAEIEKEIAEAEASYPAE